MKAIFLKHRSGCWIARVYNRQAEILKTGHTFGYGHEFSEEDSQIKQWLVEAFTGGIYKIASAEEFEEARSRFVEHAFELAHPDYLREEAREICLRTIEQEEARA